MKLSKSTGNNDGGQVVEKFLFGFPRRFLEISFTLSTPCGFRSNSKETKNPVFRCLTV